MKRSHTTSAASSLALSGRLINQLDLCPLIKETGENVNPANKVDKVDRQDLIESFCDIF